MNEIQTVYLWPDISLLVLNNIKSTMHSHYAMEIYISPESYFEMDFGGGFNRYRSLIIDSNIPHRFSGEIGNYLLVLINPNHDKAYIFNQILNGKPFKELDFEIIRDTASKISSQYKKQLTGFEALKYIEKLLSCLGRDFSGTSEMDYRIKKTVSVINSTYNENLSLVDLADISKLSKSRLRHLFKKETGITLRRYILNKRVIEAVKLIIEGYSKTYAAHETGFSDSAHLSRTYRQLYGLSLSDLLKKNQNVKIFFDSK